MVTCPPPLYVLLNCLIRLSTTCWADEGWVVVHIVTVVPDPEAAPPTPPHAASPAVAVRVAATAATLYLTPDLDNMLSPLAFPAGQANSRLRAPSMLARRNSSRTCSGQASKTLRSTVIALKRYQERP